MSDMQIATTWITTTLSGDATLRGLIDAIRVARGIAAGGRFVYEQPAPNEAKYPLIVFQSVGPEPDLVGLGGLRIKSAGEWLVRVVDEAESYASLWAIDARIDALLHHPAGGTVAGVGLVISSLRVRPYKATLPEGGTLYKHLGGVYRLQTQRM